MSDIYERANTGDIDALRDLLGILHNQKSEELFHWVEKALQADPENSIFLNYMGICYNEYGWGITPDEDKAIEYYRKAAELGNEKSARNLAWTFYERKNPEAFKWAQKAYELGELEGAGMIAAMYEVGLGVPVDKEEAFKWNLKGAEAGDIQAQSALAIQYLYGEGCPANIREAIDWLRTSAEGGNENAAKNLSIIYRTNEFIPADMETSIHYAIMAAEATYPELNPLYDIADMYRKGDGVEKNPQKALELYKIVADNGNVDCMENVGVMYAHEEHGIPRDIEKAIEYFEKAAVLGSEKAMYNLKLLYKEKFHEDHEKYYFSRIQMWADEGNVNVLTELGILYHDGIGVGRDIDKGNTIIRSAADKGEPRALSIISKMLFDENKPEAEKYIIKSLQAGNDDAKVLLGKMYTSGGAFADKEIEGIKLLRESAEQDENPEAMFTLAKYEEKDGKREGWWEKAAELGHREALYRLTDLKCTLGEFKEAEKWAKLGIDQGIIGCANLYADMLYYKHIGTDSEQNTAYTYYEKTANAGNAYGMKMLGKCYLFNAGGAVDSPAKAIENLTKAIEFLSTDPEALIYLGCAYSKDGATKNAGKAAKYLRQGLDNWGTHDKKDPMYVAAANILFDMYNEDHLESSAYLLMKKLVDEGFDECKMNLAICYIDGLGTSKDHAKAKSLIESVLRSSAFDDQQKETARNILSELLRGNYGTDSSISGTVGSGTINHTDNSVSYRPSGSTSTKSSGCYIATCVYGSYDCPNVWVLRRYRDEKLAKSTLGRMFIKFYYATSPILVKIFGNHKWFKNIWAGVLDPFVAKLKKEGFSDQKYCDR